MGRSFKLIVFSRMKVSKMLSVSRHYLTLFPDIGLIQVLVNALMRWVIRSQPSQIEDHMQGMISRGVGHLVVVAGRISSPKLNYPMHIAEPLTILSLSTIFEQQPWTHRKKWITNAMRTAPDKPSFGITYEEMIILLLMENFGGKFTRLGDVFHFAAKSSLGSREVTLVSLMRRADGVMLSCEASWSTGSSDRFGFKAQSPANVLDFLNDPKGKPFLLPDNHMGPDVICFLQDKKTQELILLILQSKTKQNLDTKTWLEAIYSVNPEFFYTIVVRLSFFIPHCSDEYFIITPIERWNKETICTSDIPKRTG